MSGTKVYDVLPAAGLAGLACLRTTTTRLPCSLSRTASRSFPPSMAPTSSARRATSRWCHKLPQLAASFIPPKLAMSLVGKCRRADGQPRCRRNADIANPSRASRYPCVARRGRLPAWTASPSSRRPIADAITSSRHQQRRPSLSRRGVPRRC